MAQHTVGKSAVVGSRTFQYSATETVDGELVKDPTLAAAKTGTLTTRSSGTAGTLTMSSGHGITDGAVIDIYWADGSATSATVGTVATNSVPFTGATGDALPLANTAITAMVVRLETFVVPDADLNFLAVAAGPAPCCAVFLKADNTIVGRVQVRAADGAAMKHYIWDGTAATIPISDDVANVRLSHGDSANSRQVTCLATID